MPGMLPITQGSGKIANFLSKIESRIKYGKLFAEAKDGSKVYKKLNGTTTAFNSDGTLRRIITRKTDSYNGCTTSFTTDFKKDKLDHYWTKKSKTTLIKNKDGKVVSSKMAIQDDFRHSDSSNGFDKYKYVQHLADGIHQTTTYPPGKYPVPTENGVVYEYYKGIEVTKLPDGHTLVKDDSGNLISEDYHLVFEA